MGRPPDHPSGAKVPMAVRITPENRNLLRQLARTKTKTQTQVLEELIAAEALRCGLT